MDSELIEGRLIKAECGGSIIKLYFPGFHASMRQKPAIIFSKPPEICCDYCGKNLLDPADGIWALWWIFSAARVGEGTRYVDMHFACKGNCDRRVSARIKAKHASEGGIYDRWDDIPDFCIPTVFVSKIMALMNGFASGDTFTPEALDRMKELILAVFPHISRHLSPEDEKEAYLPFSAA